MGRYSGTLHKLAETGPAKKGNWNLLLNYLEGYAVRDMKAKCPKFDSPLQEYTSPNEELMKELTDGQGSKREDTPLRISVGRAPADVIAALCHMGPEAARMSDEKGRLPLHLACRRSSEDPETDAVLRVLIIAYPEGLVHRDDCGRTPLHYLMWYHAHTRNSKLVDFFCQPLPEGFFVGIKQPPTWSDEIDPLPEIPTPDAATKIPRSASIVHDMKHGALPIHYAAAGGASQEVIKSLLAVYPISKGLVDRKGRTPLAWLLGAGALVGHHVSGELIDPNAPPVWERKVSDGVVQLLVSSKVARMTDDTGRYPIHWAMHLMARDFYNSQNHESSTLSLESVQVLMDNYIQALTTPDLRGLTPLHVLFDTVTQVQESEWARMCRNKTFRDDVDLVMGGSRLRRGYEPSSKLIQMLCKPPDSNVVMLAVGERPTCAAHVEDRQGRLPLHLALHVASSASVIRLLIQFHPTSLLHTMEETMQTPLHVALSSPYTTPLQSLDTMKLLMQAYVTSRHGTFVDGRLVLKMEDASGQYPLHYACENQASLEVTRLLFMSYPKSVMFQNASGDYPFHCFLDPNLFGSTDQRGLTVGATLAMPMGWTSEGQDSFRAEQLRILQQKMSLLIEPLCQDEEVMKAASSTHGMLPLHICVAFDVVPYSVVYHMLNGYPGAVKTFTTASGHAYSPMDLHEMRRSANKDDEKWHMIRELLFSFGPTLDVHRRQDELLDRCARLIRDELDGRGSSHATAFVKAQKVELATLNISETLSSIEPPEIDHGGRPKTKPQSPKMTKTPKAKKVSIIMSMVSTTKKEKQSPVKKSIYDDDAELGYVVSPDVSFGDDEYFSDEQSKEEEYNSDEYDSRYDDDDMFDDEQLNPSKSDAIENLEAKQERSRKSKSELEEATLSLTSQSGSPQSPRDVAKPFLSDVAFRLWLFFAMFTDPESPEDHYAKQVEFILDHLKFSTVQKLLMLPLPSYVSKYLEEECGNPKGHGVQEVANANCKAIMHMSFYFVGRYEFHASQSENVLIHRSMDGDTVMVRATEHLATTVETTEEVDPGQAEASIWATGAAPTAPRTKRTFSVSNRSVCFKFMQSAHAYESEVGCRKIMGVPVEDEAPGASNIVPLINHFNALQSHRPVDEKFRQDIQDERFQRLEFQSDGPAEDEENSIFLPDYPYAIVMPYSDDGNLNDHLFHHGTLGMDKIREIGSQVGKSLQLMHEKGLVHGNVTLLNVAGVPFPEVTTLSTGKYWALADLSCATKQDSRVSYMAPIPLKGSVQFSTGAFPPEMFVKLTPGELRMYNEYWEAVEARHQITMDKAVVCPRLCAVTGDAYVLRCYFSHADHAQLPSLPYKLLPTQEAADIWSFGRFLFILCSAGHPLFSTNLRTGHLLDYDQIATWDQEKCVRLIYEHVEDPLAQDLLLRILSSHDERAALTMESLLGHPFFTPKQDSPPEKKVRKLVDQCRIDSVARKRTFMKQVEMRSEEEWLKVRTTTLLSWDLDLQMRIHLAPSEFVRRELAGGHQAATMPYSIIVLPYKLARNKAGKLTPSTKSEIEMAERMGVQLISLSKACRFARRMEVVIGQSDDPSRKWSLTEIVNSLASEADDFQELISELSTFAHSDAVVVVRDSPLLIFWRLIQERIKELHCLFEDAGRAFLYLVDEYEGVPIVSTSGTIAYPIEVTEKVTEMVTRGLPFMHFCMLYARGVSGDASGLVKLIFEAAYPHIPPSWAEAANGLSHSLVDPEIKEEVRILREATANLFPSIGPRSIDDLRFFQAYFEHVDVKRHFAHLERVTSGEASIWTSASGVEQMEQLAKSHGLAEAYEAKRSTEQKLLDQERKIAELEEALETLKFRRTLNLQDYQITS